MKTEEKVVGLNTAGLIAIVIVIVCLVIAGKWIMNRNKPSEKLMCALLFDPFHEVGRKDDWYNLAADVMKERCNYDQADYIAAQQICKTHYMQDRFDGKNPKPCLNMDFK